MRRAKYAAASAAGAAVAAVALVVLAACQSGSANQAVPPAHSSGSSAPASSTSAVPTPALHVSPADFSTDVPLDSPVVVSAENATLSTVKVVDADGNVVAGALTGDAHGWTTSGLLAASTAYRVEIAALDGAGKPTTLSSSFTTLTPAKVLGAKIAPLEGETVGVGMPVVIYFTAPVQNRAAVEQRLHVESSIPIEGSWHWYGSSEVHFRPKAYWPAGDQVTLHADIAGVDAGNSTWGVEDHTVHFTVGDSHISVVDAKTHEMTVQVNGKTVRTIPVSTGRDKYPTTSGVHLVLEKEQKVIMDSATVGIPRDSPDGYYETVFWDVRISWSGEFVHAAPWSTSSQGRTNVSHGCVNISDPEAQWFYGLSQRGDVVQVINTVRPLESGNGWTDWNMPWSQWLAGSALPMPGSSEGVNAQLSDTDPGQTGFGVYSPTPGPVPKYVPPPPAQVKKTPTPSPTPSPTPTKTPTPSPGPTPTKSPSPSPTSTSTATGGTSPSPSHT